MMYDVNVKESKCKKGHAEEWKIEAIDGYTSFIRSYRLRNYYLKNHKELFKAIKFSYFITHLKLLIEFIAFILTYDILEGWEFSRENRLG